MTPYVLLASAILAVWLPALKWRGRALVAWFPVFLAALAAGLVSGALTWSGGAALAILWVLLGRAQSAGGPVRGAFLVLAAGLALALALHVVPGFNNQIVIEAARFTPDAAPYTQYLNLDKGGAGLLILATVAQRVRDYGEWGLVLRTAAFCAAATAAIVATAGVCIGYFGLAPKLPTAAPVWAATNLLFTCIPETAFFSAFVQEPLHRLLATRSALRWLPPAAAALAFGAAHAAGGLPYAVLASAAGLGYAAAYAATRRVEAAILTHLAVNAVHFFGFTYPRLQS
jgi:hypothetical protein